MIRRPLLSAIATAGLAIAIPAAAEEATPVGFPISSISMFVVAGVTTLFLMFVFRSSLGRIARDMSKAAAERGISNTLYRHSPNVLNDFIVPGAYGGLTRINHAILTPGGIICILTKHYDGVVFCGPRTPQWTNVDGIGRQKFLNPLIQNDGRVAALQKIVPNAQIKSLVVFTGDTQFASEPECNVIYARDLDAKIAKIASASGPLDNIDADWMLIKSAVRTDEESRKDFDAQLSFS